MIEKGNVRIGLEWRFGPNWPGQRCGAKTRSGSPCKRPANKQKGQLIAIHQGKSMEAELTQEQLLVISP